MNGIVTFRGDNYRSGAAYGTASISAKSLSKAWSFEIGQMTKPSGSGNWSGSGWVGQPLVVCWPESTKQIMNMYDWAKQKQGLVEGILACLDGNVYFFDIESGEATRPVLQIGIPFKGAGSLDPRGYPIMYLGSGDNYPDDPSKTVRAVAYSLVDFSCLYTFGAYKDSFAIRDWHAYDSAPLVDAKTDTLIYPGENGILYTIKLNTEYNEQTGTLTLRDTPQVSDKQVAEMDYDTALAAAKEKSYDLFAAQRTLDDAEETYKDNIKGYSKNSYHYKTAAHTYEAAKYTYQSSVQSFELSFRTMYDAVADYQQVLKASQSALDYQRSACAAAELKYQQGSISKNTLLEARDSLASAEADVATAKHNLFSAYHTYLWAVEYGILN